MKRILIIIAFCLCFVTIKAQDTTCCEKSFYEYDVNIYPNPCSDKVMVEFGNWDYLEIYDTKGAMLSNYILYGKVIEVNMSKFENGLYIFRFKHDSYSTRRKVVKSRIYEKTK